MSRAKVACGARIAAEAGGKRNDKHSVPVSARIAKTEYRAQRMAAHPEGMAGRVMPDVSGHTIGILLFAVFIAVLGWTVYQMDKTFHE
jgi:hypothetical protein